MRQGSKRRRYAHLVGSIPYEDEATAMRRSMDFLGHSLRSLPDGEIRLTAGRPYHSDRSDWAQWVVRKLKEGGALEVTRRGALQGKSGLWPDLRRASKHRLKVDTEALHRHLDFGLCQSFLSGYEIFKHLRTQQRWKIKFQFGVPGPLALAMFSLGIMEGFRLRQLFEDRLVQECTEIYNIARDDVVFQIELPLELALSIKAPVIVRPAVREWLVNNTVSFVRRLNEGASIGIHLCLWYAGNSVIRSVKPLVKFANELARQWPKNHALTYVHMPMTMAGTRPSTDRRFYESLKKLRLPQDTRFVAGFVNGRLTEDEHAKILGMIEGISKRSADVSSACGLGQEFTGSTEDLLVTTANLVR